MIYDLLGSGLLWKKIERTTAEVVKQMQKKLSIIYRE